MADLSEKTFDYRTVYGPSFKDGLPNDDEWEEFKRIFSDADALAATELWYSKAKEAGGVPDRSMFSFEELVPYGRNIYMAKLNDEQLWNTTYCGEAIVSNVGLDATGKTLDDFATPETLKFWMKNLDKMLIEHHLFMEYYTLGFVNKDYIYCSSLTYPLKTIGSDIPNMHLVYEVFSSKNLFPDHLK